MALKLYDCYIFFAYSSPIVFRQSHVTFKITAVRTKNMADISFMFSEKNYIFSWFLHKKTSFDYISSEKYIFYFHNIHSVSVHNSLFARYCKYFSDLTRIM